MKQVRRLTQWLVVLLAIAGAGVARATHDFASVDYPGAQNTQLWDINNNGLAIGTASGGAVTSPTGFLYDTKTKLFTKLPPVPGYDSAAFGAINDLGIIVGVGLIATDFDDLADGVILENGKYSSFAHPGSYQTFPRAIGNTGLITGYASLNDGSSVGFIYDPKLGTFTDIMIPYGYIEAIIPQGINDLGRVVGSVYLIDGPDPCQPNGQYGFVRETDGTVTLFRVNGVYTRARGITNAGLITGYLTEFGEKGFAVTLPALGGFQALTIPEIELLSVPFTGATDTLAEGIDNTGHIVGTWLQPGAEHGFIATLIPNGAQVGVVRPARPASYRVPQDFATIQLAVDNAHPGDTIRVSAGRWCGAWITKPLSLIGEGATIMGCPGGPTSAFADVFKVGFSMQMAASGTSIRNFVFDGNGITDANLAPLATGIDTGACTNNLIIDSNTFQGGLIDVVVNGKNNQVTHNVVNGFTILSSGFGGSAILESGAPSTGNAILYNQITSTVPPGDFSFASWINELNVPFAGIVVSGEKGALIANNKISIASNLHGDAGVGILATDSIAGSTTADLAITNNDGRDSAYTLIITKDQYGGTSNAVGAAIRGNLGVNLINSSTANVTNRSIRTGILCDDLFGGCPSW
jgi:hypothetical protein